VIRPRALRVSQNVVEGEEEEPAALAMPASTTAFRSIGESKNEDTLYKESQNALTQVRLKPRHTSFKVGQGAWDQMPKSTAIYSKLGSKLLEL
jgi:hypothetical protein